MSPLPFPRMCADVVDCCTLSSLKEPPPRFVALSPGPRKVPFSGTPFITGKRTEEDVCWHGLGRKEKKGAPTCRHLPCSLFHCTGFAQICTKVVTTQQSRVSLNLKFFPLSRLGRPSFACLRGPLGILSWSPPPTSTLLLFCLLRCTTTTEKPGGPSGERAQNFFSPV